MAIFIHLSTHFLRTITWFLPYEEHKATKIFYNAAFMSELFNLHWQDRIPLPPLHLFMVFGTTIPRAFCCHLSPIPNRIWSRQQLHICASFCSPEALMLLGHGSHGPIPSTVKLEFLLLHITFLSTLTMPPSSPLSSLTHSALGDIKQLLLVLKALAIISSIHN